MSLHSCRSASIVALLMMCALVALIAPPLSCSAAVSPYLMVRTVEQVPIIDHGVLNPAWATQAAPNSTGPYATTQFEYPQYMISLDNTTAPPPSTTHQDYTLTYVSSDSATLTTSVDNESGILTGPGIELPSLARTVCVKEGTATVTVTMTFSNPPADTTIWSFTKVCTPPMIEVGTSPFDADVVHQSAAVDAFAGWVVLGDSLTLYAYLSNAIVGIEAPFEVTATSANDTMVTIGEVTYNASYAGATGPLSYIMQGAAQPIGELVIPLTCAAGTVGLQVQITVSIAYHYPTPLTFSFFKQCNQRPLLTDLSIGTVFNASDIAIGGVSTPAWKQFAYAPNGIAQYIFQFHMCMGCAQAPTKYEQVLYNVSMDSTDTSVYDVIVQGAPTGVLPQYADIPLYADIQCKKNGTATTTWQVDVGPQYELVEFAFSYTCVFPLLDMTYMTPTEFIAQRSVVSTSWSDGSVSIGADEVTSLFYLYLDAANDAALLPQQFYAIDILFDDDATRSGKDESPVLLPFITDPNFESAPYITAAQPISIEWNCQTSAMNTPVTISVRYGWGSFGSNTLQVKMTKSCGDGSGGGGGGGWSAAGIFFFVVFLLGLVLCLGGCGWNYQHDEKRGWEIVPLYVTATRCVDRCRGTDQSWTPQMESSHATGRTGYGGFEDSGANYQSNL